MSKQEPPEHKSLGPTAAEVPLDLLPVVELSDEQYGRAQQIARQRNRSYQSIGGGRVCGQQSSEDAHLTGTIGETAYAARNDVCIDESVYDYGDSGYDFEKGEGNLHIDVKTTATDMQRPSLVVPKEPEPSADLFFLLHRFDERSVRIFGFATLATLTERDAVPYPGDDLNFIVPQDELWSPPSLDQRVVEEQLKD